MTNDINKESVGNFDDFMRENIFVIESNTSDHDNNNKVNKDAKKMNINYLKVLVKEIGIPGILVILLLGLMIYNFITYPSIREYLKASLIFNKFVSENIGKHGLLTPKPPILFDYNTMGVYVNKDKLKTMDTLNTMATSIDSVNKPYIETALLYEKLRDHKNYDYHDFYYSDYNINAGYKTQLLPKGFPMYYLKTFVSDTWDGINKIK